MAAELKRDPDLEWLDHVQPVGLVVAPILLKELGLAPARQTQVDSAQVAEHVGETTDKPALRDPWGFFARRARLGGAACRRQSRRAAAAGRSSCPPAGTRHDAQSDLGASRSWEKPTGLGSFSSASSRRASIPTRAARSDGWEATPHQRFERLLRETGVFAGVLISEKNEPRMARIGTCPSCGSSTRRAARPPAT